MLAYVNLIQRKEKEIGCDVLTHQRWSGASYWDRILQSECFIAPQKIWRHRGRVTE